MSLVILPSVSLGLQCVAFSSPSSSGPIMYSYHCPMTKGSFSAPAPQPQWVFTSMGSIPPCTLGFCSVYTFPTVVNVLFLRLFTQFKGHFIRGFASNFMWLSSVGCREEPKSGCKFSLYWYSLASPHLTLTRWLTRI